MNDTVKAKARRGRPRAFDREEALDQALCLFRRRGYEGVSIADLTEAMGIAPPSLYAAFGSKAALFGEVLDRYVAQGLAWKSMTLASADTLAAWVRALLEASIDMVGQHGAACLVSTGMLHCGTDQEAIAASVAQRRGELFDGIAHALERWLPEKEAAQKAAFLLAALQGLSVQARDGVARERLTAIMELTIGTVIAQV